MKIVKLELKNILINLINIIHNLYNIIHDEKFINTWNSIEQKINGTINCYQYMRIKEIFSFKLYKMYFKLLNNDYLIFNFHQCFPLNRFKWVFYFSLIIANQFPHWKI